MFEIKTQRGIKENIRIACLALVLFICSNSANSSPIILDHLTLSTDTPTFLLGFAGVPKGAFDYGPRGIINLAFGFNTFDFLNTDLGFGIAPIETLVLTLDLSVRDLLLGPVAWTPFVGLSQAISNISNDWNDKQRSPITQFSFGVRLGIPTERSRHLFGLGGNWTIAKYSNLDRQPLTFYIDYQWEFSFTFDDIWIVRKLRE